MTFEKDPIGKAIYDYQSGNLSEHIIVHSDLAEDDEMALSYLFRSFKQYATNRKKGFTTL